MKKFIIAITIVAIGFISCTKEEPVTPQETPTQITTNPTPTNPTTTSGYVDGWVNYITVGISTTADNVSHEILKTYVDSLRYRHIPSGLDTIIMTPDDLWVKPNATAQYTYFNFDIPPTPYSTNGFVTLYFNSPNPTGIQVLCHFQDTGQYADFLYGGEFKYTLKQNPLFSFSKHHDAHIQLP